MRDNSDGMFFVCQGCEDPLFEHDQWAKGCMDKFGFYVHLVEFNMHTHGLENTFNHPDLQIVLPLHPLMAHQLIHDVVGLIRKGTAIQPGVRYSKIIKNLDVTFIEATETGRKVLRMILPDTKGNLDKACLTGEYAEQYNVVT